MAIDHGLASSLESPLAMHRFLVAWQNPESRAFESIGRLDATNGHFTFRYLPHAFEVEALRPLPQFPDLHQVYESPHLFVLFSQRLMNRRRPDYSTWVNMLGLDEQAPDLDVLARSEGHRLGDNIRVFPEPQVQPDGRSTATFFVHGVRHRMNDDAEVVEVLRELRRGEQLLFATQATNPVNPLAVTVNHTSVQLGWVPNPLVDYVDTLMSSGPVDATVTQNNGPEAPPNLRLLITAKGRVPVGYRPFGNGRPD